MANVIRIHHAPAATTRAVVGILPTISLWLALWSERRALANLSAHELADIGVSPEMAASESMRAPWDVPIGRL